MKRYYELGAGELGIGDGRYTNRRQAMRDGEAIANRAWRMGDKAFRVWLADSQAGPGAYPVIIYYPGLRRWGPGVLNAPPFIEQTT